MLKIKRFLKYRKCFYCGREFLEFQTKQVNNSEYICSSCENIYAYSTKNFKRQGKATKVSFSFEFETSNRSRKLYELLKYNFIGCSDSSIEGYEWKSPIFYNRKTFHVICKKIDKFKGFIGNSCGTHLHVSTPYKLKMDKYKNELFNPIINVMTTNKEQTIRFWGRYFNCYCQSELKNFNRYNAFNTISSVETLEFRLLKFINAEQYIKACDFCIDTTSYINKFIGKKDFNSEKAKKIGEAIANKYKEVAQNV